MVLMSKHKYTKTEIRAWLQRLCTPQKKLGGFAICPYLKSFLPHIHIAENRNPWRMARHFADIKNAFALEGLVVYGFHCSYDQMSRKIAQLNREIEFKDCTALMMHPEGSKSVLPLDYNLDIPVLIVQRLSTLQTARRKLKKTKYYKHYK